MNNPDRVSFITPKNQKDCFYESIEMQEKTVSLDDVAFINWGEQFIYDGQVYDFRFRTNDYVKPTPELREYYKKKYENIIRKRKVKND